MHFIEPFTHPALPDHPLILKRPGAIARQQFQQDHPSMVNLAMRVLVGLGGAGGSLEITVADLRGSMEWMHGLLHSVRLDDGQETTLTLEQMDAAGTGFVIALLTHVQLCLLASDGGRTKAEYIEELVESVKTVLDAADDEEE